MKFFNERFYLKKNKILRVHVKDNLQQFSGLQGCNFTKKRLQHECFSVNIPKVLGISFFIEQQLQ